MVCIGAFGARCSWPFPGSSILESRSEACAPKRGGEAAQLSGQYRFKTCGGEAQHLQGSNCKGSRATRFFALAMAISCKACRRHGHLNPSELMVLRVVRGLMGFTTKPYVTVPRITRDWALRSAVMRARTSA